jgi:hypothetical protein
MKEEMENNRSIVEQYSQIYEPSYIEQYKQGLITDSSTMIFEDQDPHFKNEEYQKLPKSVMDRQFQNTQNNYYNNYP